MNILIHKVKSLKTIIYGWYKGSRWRWRQRMIAQLQAVIDEEWGGQDREDLIKYLTFAKENPNFLSLLVGNITAISQLKQDYVRSRTVNQRLELAQRLRDVKADLEHWYQESQL